MENGVSLVPSGVFSPEVVEWADRINAAYKRGIENIIWAGRECCEAKADCDHGEWLQLVGSQNSQGLLLFNVRHAQMLMAISRAPQIRDNVTYLPTDARTLYQLTRLSITRFVHLLKNGTISPSMKRNEASAETRKESKEANEERSLPNLAVMSMDGKVAADRARDQKSTNASM